MNGASWLARAQIYSCLTAASHHLDQYDYFLVEKSLAALALFHGQCQGTPFILQSVSVQVPLHHHLFAVEQLPEPSIRLCSAAYILHGSTLPRPPIPVVEIDQSSSASNVTSSCAAAPVQ